MSLSATGLVRGYRDNYFSIYNSYVNIFHFNIGSIMQVERYINPAAKVVRWCTIPSICLGDLLLLRVNIIDFSLSEDNFLRVWVIFLLEWMTSKAKAKETSQLCCLTHNYKWLVTFPKVIVWSKINWVGHNLNLVC